ncbi:MAG: phosphoglucosamine mutase [Ilumatobacteraceae bacterium]|nr:phosphoglucosamine mutase [Ilumatobacteraceae bacterium]
MQFGTDGIRGVANIELTAEFALRLGRAAARILGRDASDCRVVVGGDTRESTPMLDAALCAGFAAEGVGVIRLGVAPTPQVAFEAQRLGALGAVVSASHNPFADNGIKLFARGGVKLGDDVERQIAAELESLPAPTLAAGTIAVNPEADPYCEHVLAILEGRSLAGLKVVLDTANGAAFEVAPGVLRASGAEVVVIAAEPDGRNINDECGATSPAAVAAAVVAHNADVGIALDGDADRLIAVDHTGAIVDGDHIIAVMATDLKARGRLHDDTVVVTVMTNLGFRLAMDKADIAVVETAVGDRYVLEALASGGYSLGGEQSGHVIFTDHATTGDGLLTAVALLDSVKRADVPLADLAAAVMTSLPQVLVNVRVAERMVDVAEQLADEIGSATRTLGDNGRILVRPSGTEPLIRVMVEAPTAELAKAVADEVAQAAERRFS